MEDWLVMNGFKPNATGSTYLRSDVAVMFFSRNIFTVLKGAEIVQQDSIESAKLAILELFSKN